MVREEVVVRVGTGTRFRTLSDVVDDLVVVEVGQLAVIGEMFGRTHCDRHLQAQNAALVDDMSLTLVPLSVPKPQPGESRN